MTKLGLFGGSSEDIVRAFYLVFLERENTKERKREKKKKRAQTKKATMRENGRRKCFKSLHLLLIEMPSEAK